MQQKYGDQGLVCVSVSVDLPDNRDEALAFLKAKQATFPNYWLDEEQDVWQTKLNIKAPPAIFVFDRDGRRVARFNEREPAPDWTHEDVEKRVQEVLRSKP